MSSALINALTSQAVKSVDISSLTKDCGVFFNATAKQQLSDIVSNLLMFWIFTTLFIVFAIMSAFFVFDSSLRLQWTSIGVYAALVAMLVLSIVYLAKLVSSTAAFSKNNGPVLNISC